MYLLSNPVSAAEQNEQRINFLLRLQTSFPIARWKVGGVDLWPMLRVSLGREIRRIQKFQPKPSFLTTRVLRPIFVLFLTNRLLSAVLWNTRPNVPPATITAQAVLFEPKPQGRVLEPIHQSLTQRNTTTYNLLGGSSTRPGFREMAVAFWQARRLHLPTFRQVRRLAKQHLGYHPPTLTFAGMFARALEIQLALNRYRSALDTLQPSHLFCTGTGVDTLSLFAVARRLGVITIFVDSAANNPETNHMTAVWPEPISTSLPDIFWASSVEMAERLRPNNVSKIVLSGGNASFIDAYRQAQLAKSSDNYEAARGQSSSAHMVALVALQPDVALPLDWLDQMDLLRVILRTHPAQKKFPSASLRWARRTKHSVHFQNARDVALPDALQGVGFVFTGPSSSINESAAFGVPVFVPKHFENRLTVVFGVSRAGSVNYCESGRELKERLLNLTENSEDFGALATQAYERQACEMEEALSSILRTEEVT